MNLTKALFRLFLGQRLPIKDGTLTVPGIHQPVCIRRDAYGIAYVEAQEDADAWYGLWRTMQKFIQRWIISTSGWMTA